ncbi:MAG: RNB domain-containing ribonuclease [Treponema sp.]|nr:RNB domain-containing ribonuclease [Treponema sp.]
MVFKNSIVLYKNQCALVSELDNDKYIIQYVGQDKKQSVVSVKVREKDILLLHEGPAHSLQEVLSFCDASINEQIAEIYELLLSDDESKNKSFTVKELAELLRSSYKCEECFALFSALSKSVEFFQDVEQLKNGNISFKIRTKEEIEVLKQKQFEKEHYEEERASFIKRLKQKKLILPDDAKFTVDIEALALGKTDRSKTMSEAGFSETVEKAHKLLLDTGVWTFMRNPYPSRFGLSTSSATLSLEKPPLENRMVIKEVAFAIDNEWSSDPDDAISWDGENLWVHIADPASRVLPDSEIDKVARSRGTTLYLPEGTSRMLSESALEDYALGLKDESYALSFCISFEEDGAIKDCSVHKTIVKVKRLTYEKASELKDSSELKIFFEIAERNYNRRKKAGAISVNLSEVHISVNLENETVTIESDISYPASDMIQEMMLLAGEGAARFAFKNNIPFPYVSQESPDLPKELFEGYAGKFQLLRTMRKRSVGVIPSPHAAIGVSFYSQVTSPLRRYGDLIAHEQLRAFLDARELIDKDTMLIRISEGDAASIAAKKASRFSELHWKLVYLLKNPHLELEAFCVDKKEKQVQLYIPSLDMQTFVLNTKSLSLNESCMIKAKSIDIPNHNVQFVFC